jgi:hypothetical protein
MSSVNRGEIYWLYPDDDNAMSKLGLVMETDGNESLFMMCHPDVRLAGHLDAIFEPRDTGLSFTVAAFTHVVLWFKHSRISPAAVAKVSLSVCDGLELARSGRQTDNLTYGLHLGDPVIEPRWPLIEQIVTAFIDDLSKTSISGSGVSDERTFNEALERVLIEWDQPDLTNEEKNRIQLDVMELGELRSENPDWCDEYTFYMTTEIILGTSALALAA